MRITDVRVHVCKVDVEDLTRGHSASYDWTFVQIDTDEGIAGIGEGSNIAGNGSLVVADTIRRAAHLLIGEDPTHIDRLWHKVYRYFTYVGSRGAPSAAVSAIDVALWDIKGKVAGLPVWNLLGGKHRPTVKLYGNVWYRSHHTPEQASEAAKAAVAEGYDALKFDPFPGAGLSYSDGLIPRKDLREGVEKVAAVRDAVGPDVEILLDLHAKYCVPAAIAVAKAVEPYDVTWIEEPVPPESISALRTVRENTDVPICVGERGYTRWDFAPLLEQGLVDYIMPDPNWTGGITELRKIAALAEVYNVPVSPHDVNGPLQVVAGATTMITVPNFYRQEFSIANLGIYNEALSHALDIRDGELYLPDRPGIGFELDEGFMANYAHPDWSD